MALLFLFLITLVLFILFLYFYCDGDLQLMKAEKFGVPITSLSGKVVWITGASSGIGEYLAYSLAQCKCKLVLTARREEELNRVKKQCLANGQIQESDVVIIPLDVTDFGSYDSALKKVLHHFSHIDILVNNAGIAAIGESLSISFSVDQQVLNINTLAAISLTKTVLPTMMSQGSGHIVVTSSISGLFASSKSNIYTASKFALHGYFDCLRMELKSKNISVTLICPGPVETNIFNTETGKKMDLLLVDNQKYTDVMKPLIMKSARCAHLSSVAMANKLDEVWICKKSLLIFFYLIQGIPSMFKKLSNFMVSKRKETKLDPEVPVSEKKSL